MTREDIIRRRQEIVDRQGPWTSHNLHLGHGVYTIHDRPRDNARLRRVAQIVEDASDGRVAGLRVLDLACLEGIYSIELALRGAHVVGIEGRSANLEKARFAAEALSLQGAEFVQDDVRNLSREKHGTFDVVLCLGILYHLDTPDVFHFVESIASVCTRFAIFDTHVGLTSRVAEAHRGRTYRGFRFVEHPPGASETEKAGSLWASLDNPTSFWPTRPSLLNLLSQAGFTSVHECHVPVEADKPSDRVTLLAFRGRSATLRSAPDAERAALTEWPERSLARPHPDQRPFAVVRASLPDPVRRLLRGARRILGR